MGAERARKAYAKAKLAFASFRRCTEDCARLIGRSEEQDWRLIVDYGHDYGQSRNAPP